ncbi:hypothetical protein [Salinilacihabitans rarus]|uniref:hypothetical protein n=1 Tax=Salinilacihabitans rarus TaxID=2961596 RepID=UPI0020C8935B|nr:hypothetical protein [Salinilacihabitans rarus]
MQDATSTAASVGTELLLDGRLDGGAGVRPPEVAVPPEPFVDRLRSEPGLEFWTGRCRRVA